MRHPLQCCECEDKMSDVRGKLGAADAVLEKSQPNLPLTERCRAERVSEQEPQAQEKDAGTPSCPCVCDTIGNTPGGSENACEVSRAEKVDASAEASRMDR